MVKDKILKKVGLGNFAKGESYSGNVNSLRGFKSYVTDEYRNSERRDKDEVYRMFESNLLHLESGLRFRILSSESYDGESVSYQLSTMYILDKNDNEIDILDVDFTKKFIVTEIGQIKFSETIKKTDGL